MCGIIGIISKKPIGFSHPELDWFLNALVCSTLRGADGTGVFGITKSGNAEYIKVASHPFALVNSTKWKDFYANIYRTGVALIGHTRAASEGKVDNAHTHPFTFGHTILVHNGNISNYRQLLDEYKLSSININLSSEAATLLIGKVTPLEVIPKMEGSFAFVWYNASEKRLYLTHNDQRPLAVIETDSLIIIGSELDMLLWLAKRSRFNIVKDIAYDLKENTLISLDITNPGGGWKNEEYTPKPREIIHKVFHKLEVKPVEPQPVKPKDECPVLWIPEDFKEVDGVRINHKRGAILWRMWGSVANVESKISVVTHQLATEEEIFSLVEKSYLVSDIKRRKGNNELIVYNNREANVMQINGFILSEAQYNYIKANLKCKCGIKCENLEDEDMLISTKDGLSFDINCLWCVSADLSIQRNQQKREATS